MNPIYDIIEKTLRMIAGCRTLPQVETCERYLSRARFISPNADFSDQYIQIKKRKSIINRYGSVLEGTRCMVVSNEDVPVEVGSVVKFDDFDKVNQDPLPIVKFESDGKEYLCMGIVLPYNEELFAELNSLPAKKRWNRVCRPSNQIAEKEPMTKEEIINWMVDAYVMIGEKNNEGKDEGKCLLGTLIDILKNE